MHESSFPIVDLSLGEYNPNNQPANEDGRLRSALITRDDRKYYLDLKENERGRFLRVRNDA